jgi:hypothetical protein
LALLVTAIFIISVIAVVITIVFRYAHVLEEWGLFSPVIRLWQSSFILVIALYAAGVLLIAFPFGGMRNHVMPKLGIVTACLALLYVCGEAAFSVLLNLIGSTSFLDSPWFLHVSLLIVAPANSAADVLLWVILSSLVRRSSGRRLWLLPRIVIAAMLLCCVDELVMGITYLGDTFDSLAFLAGPGDIGESWGKFVETPCWIVAILVMWVLLRRMRTEMSTQAAGEHRSRTA